MKLKKSLCVTCIAASLTACGTAPPAPSQAIPADAGRPRAEAKVDQEQFRKEVYAELDICQNNAKQLGMQTWASRGVNIAIATIGIVAGSIVVPALSAANAAKSTIAAWGGVSGAANAGQAALNANGVSAATSVDSQRQFMQNVQTQLNTMNSVDTVQKADTFLAQLHFICSVAVDGPPPKIPDPKPPGS